MVNYTAEETRRVDWTFGIAYGDDTAKAKEIILELISQEEKIFNDPKPFVAVSALADSSVNFTVRAWTRTEHYWDVFFPLNEKVYNTFNEKGINIPFPQMDVHVHNKQ